MKKFLRNPLTVVGCVLFGGIVLLALLAPILPLADPNETNLRDRLLAPGSDGFLLGTDTLGRDILSRLVWGTRVSLAVAAAATLIAAFVGSLIGLCAGFFRGWVDTVLMRGIDMVLAFPYLILALAIVAVLGPGLLNALIAIAVVNIPFFARSVRGTALTVSAMPFVEAARIGGQPRLRTLFAGVFPNVLPVIVIAMSTTLGWMILETAGLSFLGLGAQPPQADLGSMLADGRKVMLVHPHVGLLPGVCILILVIGINLIGDGLRDWLDPRLEGGAHSAPGAATSATRAADIEPDETTGDALVRVRDLEIVFGEGEASEPAVHDVSFSLKAGECLGIVGESGSGKSVTAMALARLVASPPGRITAGSIHIDGIDVLSASEETLRGLRGARVGYVFQNPFDSLHPVIPVGKQLAEAVRAHGGADRKAAEVRKRVTGLLDQVGIPDPEKACRAYPHQFSGGQCQRIAIAMALANEPKVLVADEPTTALDVTVQKRVLELLARIRREHGLAMVFISHDLGVVREVADKVIVMRRGKVVESGNVVEVLRNPQHEYTRRLIASIPRLGAGPEQSLGLDDSGKTEGGT
ncbi:MAG: dipeptide/oligopeptide/nickel ABC transporter permease/ATP-binding protein [Opitutales bacterium]|nr:dipeptide/oligopeptide/nickel ABC transporter permease/ATP-binding protein [Opitutales bacterium]